ncbi:hypothetical protein KSP39_PZI016581 [Platanthera zijinensis]|uniref:Uncharacterized protein n=1 Tax=Platanthera zijinensis TaxID=2320716 RepID=A0AAP0B7M9_9ASPA
MCGVRKSRWEARIGRRRLWLEGGMATELYPGPVVDAGRNGWIRSPTLGRNRGEKRVSGGEEKRRVGGDYELKRFPSPARFRQVPGGDGDEGHQIPAIPLC